MIQIPIDDTEFEDKKITSFEGGSATFDDGWSLWVGDLPFSPAKGTPVRLYGRGLGYPVRGVVIGGHIVRYQTPAEARADSDRQSREYAEKHRLAKLEPKTPNVATPGFEWPAGGREVSGFGGGYERACRQMISQGCAWWTEHPAANPKFRGFKEVYGLCMEDNDDAKSLSAAILIGVDGASGAMHQAAVSHVFAWHRLGSWEAYLAEMKEDSDTPD